MNTERLTDDIKNAFDQLKARIVVSDDAMRHLNQLYALIWTEACYDPDTEDTQKYAARLLPHIEALNKELKFKR